MANYVKFMRGPKAAFDALITKNADTLYFVTEDDKINLYLGDTLISNSDAILSDAAKNYLDSLTNALSEDEEDPNLQLQNGQFLIYNVENNNWIPWSLDIFIGATAGNAGQSGLVPAPGIGKQDNYLRGDGTWANVTEDILPYIIDTIVGENVDTSFDTLKEISTWILNHPAGVAEINERLTNIENALGFEYEDIPVQAEDPESEDGLAWEKDEDGEYILDEDGNKIPVYETENVQAEDPESEDGLAWEKDEDGDYIFDEDGNKIPVYETEIQNVLDENGDPLLDENNEPITEEVIKTIIVTEHVLINDSTNKLNNLENVTNSLLELLDYAPATENNNAELNRILNLENQVDTISSLLHTTEDGQLDFIIPPSVGNLEDLLMVQEAEAAGEEGPESLVESINILDNRMRWHQITNN